MLSTLFCYKSKITQKKKTQNLFISSSTGGQSRRSQRDPGTARVTGAEGRRGWAAGDSRLLFPTPQQAAPTELRALGLENKTLY